MRLHHLLTLFAISICSYAAVDVISANSTSGNALESIRQIEGKVNLDKLIKTTVKVVAIQGQQEPPLPGSNEAGNFIPNSITALSMANPAERITVIEPPSASETGAALLSFPIMLPAGRLGMQPDIVLGYNSDGGNGWLGLDWALSTEAVTLETRWGVPRYEATNETETYLLNGMQLSPVAHRSKAIPRQPDRKFHHRIEGDFSKITRHGDNPKNYWWEVVEKNGTRKLFGGTTDGALDASAVLTDVNGNIAHWALTESRDANGNFIKYRYENVADGGIGDRKDGFELYLTSISYTGHDNAEGKYTVEFIRGTQLGEGRRTDVIINGRLGFKRVTADLLRIIKVKYDKKNIRSYELKYTHGAFYKTLLQSISTFDAEGKLFYTHDFEYYNDVNENGTFKPLLTSTKWEPGNDNVKGTFLNPIPLFNDNASMLSGNKAIGGGFGLAITAGPIDANLAMKTNTAGVNFGFSYTRNEGMLALIDINGDGLLDKVYKKNGALFFRANKSVPGGDSTFGEIQAIHDIDEFNRGETFVADVGLESHFGIFAGFDYTHTEDITSVYFSDVNGDMLMDIVKDGKVFFNYIDSLGEPHFSESSGDSPSVINAESGIASNLVTHDPQALEKAIDDNPLHDIVRVWKAPINGTISITGAVALHRDLSPDAKSYAFDDGVRIAIEHKESELWSTEIKEDDFVPKNPVGVNAIPVKKGEKIYFRVQSKVNGAYDRVIWVPQITYAQHIVGLNDANALPVYQFKADDDFLLSSNTATGIGIDGQVRITGNFVKPVTSDDITIKITRKSNNIESTLLQQTLAWNVSANIPIVITKDVLRGDELKFSIASNTNIDWKSLQWDPYVYFVSSADPAITQVFDSKNRPLIYFYPTVDFRSYNRTIQPTLPWTAPVSDTFSIQPNPGIDFSLYSGEVVFTIKKQNQLIAKQVIPVSSGALADHPEFSLILSKGDRLFFEYHLPDQNIANTFNSSAVRIDADPGDAENFSGGLHTLDTSFIFGPLYRHWGQFAYNGNRDRAKQPIKEMDLHLDESLTDPNPPKIDLKAGLNPTEMQAIYDAAGGNKPKEDKFIYLVPHNEKQAWIGYDNLTYVKKDTLSASRMGKDNLLPVNPVTNPNPGTGSGAVGINRVSSTDNFSFAVGIYPVGFSASAGFTRFSYDFSDMNGDRYPDILSTDKIQFTYPYGGLESSAKNFSFEAVSYSGHYSLGATLGGTFLKSNSPNSRSTPKGAKAAKAGGQAGNSAGIGVEFNYNSDSAVYAWMDINGDELPDRVHRNGTVELNIGYSFLAPVQWGFEAIAEGSAISYGGGLSINIGSYSIAAGVGLSRTENETKRTLQDMNGDGLLDYIADVSPLMVAINKGNGFADPVEWGGAASFHKGVATGESANGAFTIGIPITPVTPVVKLCINPSFHVSQGADRTVVQIEDIDGDGFPDYLQSDDDSKLSVARSTIKRTNRLKKVKRPLGANFTLDYKRVGNTYDLPFSVWTLASVDIYDGVEGDGANRMRTTFQYQNGRYNRHEREFYGFGKTITTQHDTENGDEVYRIHEVEYNNASYYERGLLKAEVIKDAAGNKFNETIYSYQLKDISNGLTLPDAFKMSDDGAAFPALISTQELYYEGTTTAQKATQKTFTYDLHGNTISSTDFGDPGPADDVTEVTTYHSVPARHIMNVPSSITTSGSGVVYRRQSTLIDNNTGNIIENNQHLQSGEVAKFTMQFDAFGNMVKITRPQNAAGQRLSYNFKYDPEVQTYRTSTSDSYGYSSSATYDVRFGELLTTTDQNGQQTIFTLDAQGRILTIKGPMEIASGQAFTVSYEYHPNAIIPWAAAKHFDPAHPANYIETATFCDGFGREIQRKKDVAIFVGPHTDDQERMQVSGAEEYDAFGRIIKMSYPITEAKGTTGILNTTVDDELPVKLKYDVLDRLTSSILQDKSVNSMQFGFDKDRDGHIQFKSKLIDGNGISVEKYTNVRGLLKATKEQHRQGNDVWTSYDYNPVDDLIKVKDDLGNQVIYTYDQMGRKTSVNHPDAGVSTYKYDLNSNPVQTITANLQGTDGVTFTYDHERIQKISYPKNPQNNVVLTYGGTGSPFYRAGRIVMQQDGSGTQEFFYNSLGETVKINRVINIPGSAPLNYVTEWNYDTWHRLTSMLYPDGEKLDYKYNVGGLLLSMTGTKDGMLYNYIPQSGYDKFEERVYMRYGNGTETTYEFEPGRRRLQKMTAKTAANRMMLDNVYTYDKTENVTSIINNAPVPPANLMGGASTYQYTYDDLYRLTNASGSFRGSSHEHRFSLAMTYNNIYGILSKNQVHERKSKGGNNWVVQNPTTYSYIYNYSAAKPHAPDHVGDKAYKYDASGNQTAWKHDKSAQNRNIVRDEENRVASISDNGEMFNYTYDASGDRVTKSVGQGQTVRVNGKKVAQSGGIGNYTVYVNPYLVVRSGGYTKHFYIEGERIVSKLGESGNGKSNGSKDNGGNNGGNIGGAAGNGVNQEAFQFYYHYDHLGNTSYVTNRLGEVYQHLEYFPFGETFIEEHSNRERTPYLYNAKELDEETGLYYYGARYYDTKINTWESVDPLWEVPHEINRSPYAYVQQNPTGYVDEDGLGRVLKITKKSAAIMVLPFDIHENPAAAARPASSGVKDYQVGSYGVMVRLGKKGDKLTPDHQPGGAQVKEALRRKLHLKLTNPLTRGMLRNAYMRAVTIMVDEKWHMTASRTYGGRNTIIQIKGDASDLTAAAKADWQPLKAHLRKQGLTTTQIATIRRRLRKAQYQFFLTGRVQYAPK